MTTAPASSAAPRDLGEYAERVLAKGREEAERIVAAARAEANEILQKAAADARATAEKARVDAENEARMMERNEMSGAELESKRKRLLAQKQVLDQVASAALGRVAELPSDKRRTLIGALLVRAKRDVPAGGVFCPDTDRPQAEAAGYRYLGPLQGAGGIVVESADGRFRVDLRYETILHDTWARSVKDVVGALNQ